MRRALAWTAGALLLVLLLGVTGIGWYYSGEILTVERPGAPAYETRVLEVRPSRVTLEANDESTRPGTWGLDAPEAYAQVGEIIDVEGDEVVRRLEPISGELRQGDLVDVDGYAYPQDPREAFNFDVSSVDVRGPLGAQPAWLAPAGGGSRWAVLVHGRAARHNECFRMLPILRDLDVTSLCITYRNDEGTPPDPDRIYRQGATEWEDVDAAVKYALDNDAREILLVGFSMGGQITANFLRRSPLATHVTGVIWDGPLLDWGPALHAAADDRGVPEWLVPIGMQASEWRAGVDYDELNHVAHADEFTQPILLFHGTEDGTVPVSVSDAFAEARADIVTYHRVAGAGHVTAWNHGPARYAEAVEQFVNSLQ